MGSVTRIGGRRRSADTFSTGVLNGAAGAALAQPAMDAAVFGHCAVGADELIDAADEHTRRLLERRPGARRGRVTPPTLVLADVLGLSLSFACASFCWAAHAPPGPAQEFKLFVFALPCWILAATLGGLYGPSEGRADCFVGDDVVGVFSLLTCGAWLLVVASRIAGWTEPSVLGLAGFWLLAVCIVPMVRAIASGACKRSAAHQQNTVIVGAGEIGQLICHKLLEHPEYGANVVGFIDRTPKIRRPDLPEHISVFGGLDRLGEVVERLQVERVVIAFSSASVPELLAVVRDLRARDVQVDLVPWLFELVGSRASIHAVEGLPLVRIRPHGKPTTARLLKRIIDVVGSAIGLLVSAPLMAYIALRVRSGSPGPIFVRQTRLGAGMKEFTALKFRIMNVHVDSAQQWPETRSTSFSALHEENGLYVLDRSDSLTRVGRWLRKTNLENLPQLLNVLRGHMSLVGPRPCPPYEAEDLEPHQLDRFLMPQGLTGLSRVTGRAGSTYAEALDLDAAYVRDWSLGLDLRILLRTLVQLLRRVRTAAQHRLPRDPSSAAIIRQRVQ